MEVEEVGYTSEASGKSERSLDLHTPTVDQQAPEETTELVRYERSLDLQATGDSTVAARPKHEFERFLDSHPGPEKFLDLENRGPERFLGPHQPRSDKSTAQEPSGSERFLDPVQLKPEKQVYTLPSESERFLDSHVSKSERFLDLDNTKSNKQKQH